MNHPFTEMHFCKLSGHYLSIGEHEHAHLINIFFSMWGGSAVTPRIIAYVFTQFLEALHPLANHCRLQHTFTVHCEQHFVNFGPAFPEFDEEFHIISPLQYQIPSKAPKLPQYWVNAKLLSYQPKYYEWGNMGASVSNQRTRVLQSTG